MNSLEKALIALRGAFQYADQHNIQVDNKHSIELINKTLDDYTKEETYIREEKLSTYTELINLIRKGYFKEKTVERIFIEKVYKMLSEELFPKNGKESTK